MLRIGICDDVRDARFSLRCALERILETRAIESEFFEFSSGDSLMNWMKHHAGELDLIFLDIEMHGSNGMETAKHLRSADKSIQLVFVTGYSDFVFDGYSVGALGYLMKPPATDALDDILTRALTAMHRNANQVFVCRNSDGMYRIPKSTILYFASEKRLVTCVTATKHYPFYAKLDEVATDAGPLFVRIHQRYIVNAVAVERIEKDAVQVGARTLPISRAYQKEAMLALTRAMLN